jgi:hypothetical protein
MAATTTYVFVATTTSHVTSTTLTVITSYYRQASPPHGRHFRQKLLLQNPRPKTIKNSPQNRGSKRVLNRIKPNETAAFMGSARNPARRECPETIAQKP